MKTIRRRKKPYKGNQCPYCHVELEYKYELEGGNIKLACPQCKYYTV